MNGRLELRIITQPYSEVYWGYMYFRRLVFGNSLTKHNKLTSFSCSVVIFSSRFPTYHLVSMLTLPTSHICLSPVTQLLKDLLTEQASALPSRCPAHAISEVMFRCEKIFWHSSLVNRWTWALRGLLGKPDKERGGAY